MNMNKLSRNYFFLRLGINFYLNRDGANYDDEWDDVDISKYD